MAHDSPQSDDFHFGALIVFIVFVSEIEQKREQNIQTPHQWAENLSECRKVSTKTYQPARL
jgi:hypothetical protein